MPLPWKKPRVTRISRLVADLQQSPKRGGSLVVETGFPTSLIDLFVKNRDRLKKSSKRKHSRQIQTPTSLSTPLNSSPPATPRRSCNSDHVVEDKKVEEVVEVDDECNAGGGGAVDGAGCDGDQSGGGSVFSAVLKIGVVVALGLGSRKVAMGVMIAAFLLLYVEYVGTRFLCFLKPCPESRLGFLDSWVRKGLLILKRWERSTKKLEVQEETELESNCIEEIQIVEPNFEEISGSLKGSRPLDSETEVSSEKGETIEVLIRNEQTQIGKIRRSNFIKKFVPKRLRNGKKERKSNEKVEINEKKPEVCRNVEEIGEEVRNKSEKQEQEVKAERYKGLKEGGTCISGKKEERMGNSVHLILLAIVVLVGLVGGRAHAFVLTVTWCLMIRFVGRGRQIRSTEVGVATIPS
ncbi:hypothetical protein SLE2022_338810 [Rubroshorea leprosula]